ncbi:hypothetical protein [Parachryseolinea silvisoli]|uniref:hypothetical protein n=1 Tax=Parachryseolinea silvisoli TaxID=2873601 RepID=UPI0022657EF4|nr:hypothetical protein [Parachryseolinea silvisoli]MCD9016463.1 hypothetical protein [Parachryseolinea silvisoli]
MKKLALSLAIALLTPLCSLRAQEDPFVVRLKEKLAAFYENRLPVKLHLFFNQPAYYPGDTAYFHISFLSEQGLRGIGGRQIIQVSLMDGQNTPVIRQQVLIRDGFGYNQLVIPPSLPAGMYTVTAYSNWMNNFDKSLLYQTRLPIVTEKSLAGSPIYTPAFYPEGGNLVQQVSNKIVMTGAPGTQNDIVTSSGSTVATCTLDSAGLGFFFLTPQPGETYTAVGSKGVRTALPASTNVGVNMLLTHTSAEAPVRIILQAGQQTFTTDHNRAYLVISAQGHVYYSATIQFGESRNGMVMIPVGNLPSGMTRATLFRPDGTVLAERLFFVEEAAPVQITSTFDKQVYNTREKVTLKLHVEDKTGITKTKLQVRIYQHDLFPPAVSPRIHPLQVSGNLPYTAYAPFLTSTPQAFDNFLITQQDKLFTWPDVWNNAEARNDYSFSTSLRFAGRATFQQSSKPLPDSTRITFFLEKDVMTYSIYLNKEGRFSFPLLNDFIGDDLVYYRADVKGVTVKDVVVTMSLEDAAPPTPDNRTVYRETATSSPYATFATQKLTIDQAYGFLKHAQQQNYEKANPHAFLEEEIFGPDVTVNLRDYLLFPDMEETLREIIPFVQHRWHNKQHVVRVFLPDLEALGKESPVYIIDGVLTDDTDYFMSLKPEDVATIKVVCSNDKLRTFGQIGKSGIVLIETTIPGNAASVPIPVTTLKVQGITPIKPLLTGADADAIQRYPQILPALYWNPDVTTDEAGNATLSFYTPDNTGEYNIEIDGITYSGKPVTASGKFNVVYQPGPMGKR